MLTPLPFSASERPSGALCAWTAATGAAGGSDKPRPKGKLGAVWLLTPTLSVQLSHVQSAAHPGRKDCSDLFLVAHLHSNRLGFKSKQLHQTASGQL